MLKSFFSSQSSSVTRWLCSGDISLIHGRGGPDIIAENIQCVGTALGTGNIKMSKTDTVPEIASSNKCYGENYHRGMGRRATDRLVKKS